MISIYKQTAQELLEGTESAPGRVRTFLTNPKRRTTPHSCTRYEWYQDLADLLTFLARALKGGSGIKVTFPTDTKMIEPRKLGKWKVAIHPLHPEREAIEQTGLLTDDDFNFDVADSIEGQDGILDSWEKLINYTSWDGLIINLSNFRPIGTVNSNGLVASGAESFLLIYQGIARYIESGTIESLIKLLGTLNDVMLRGGSKRGIITSTMSSECPLIIDYLNIPIVEVAGSHKKGVILHRSAFRPTGLIDLIRDSRNKESTFIEKPCGAGLAWNVCMAIMLAHKATCLIWRINLGMCQISDIRPAFRKAAYNGCELHTTWRDVMPELAAYYAKLEDDRQIGLDVMGLANLLAIEGVTYKQFANALDFLLKKFKSFKDIEDIYLPDNKALAIAYEIIQGYNDAKIVCDEYMIERNLPLLDRIFTVEPAQNHSYETFDRVGKTTCRGIFAPTGRIVNRTSGTQQNKRYFHGQVETDVMVGVKLHERICDLWQIMMNQTGRSHGISQDTWSETTLESLEEFMERPSQALYYDEQNNFNQRGFLSKSVQKVEVISKTLTVKDNFGQHGTVVKTLGYIGSSDPQVDIAEADIDTFVCDVSRPGECSACDAID